MKKTAVTKWITIFAATVIAAMPFATSVSAADATVNIPATAYVKEVKDNTDSLIKGNLEVSIPDDVSGSYNVKAYEILRLVIPKDSTWTITGGTPAGMTNETGTKNIYWVTEQFKALFADAKTAYLANNDDGAALRNATKVYLTYDDTNSKLLIRAAAPASGTKDEDYVEIDNAAGSKIDQNYFEASIISKLTGSDVAPTETVASAVRLFSDWASKYQKSKNLEANATAVWDATNKKYKFENTNALVYGYHLIVTTDKSNNQNTPALNQNILNVPQASNVTLKASPITIDKSVSNLLDANNNNNGTAGSNNSTTKLDVDTAGGTKYDKLTANIGDVNHYVVESHIPSYTSFDLVKAGTDGKLLALNESLTETNIDTQTVDKYVFVFRDTMQNQDFIPTDITDTTKYGAAVNGLRVKIKASGTYAEVVYKVKDYGTNEYYIVENDTDPLNDAIGRLWETDYTAASKKNFFAINFDMQKLKALNLDGRDIEISYNAELMGEAANSDSTNSAKLRYSNDPFNPSTYSNDTTTDTTTVYTYDVQVDKLFSDGSTATTLYDKVKFKLYSDAAKQHVVYFTNSSAGSYVRADSNDATKTDELGLSTTGTLLLHGLGEGTYYLVEQTNADLTSAGYNVLNPITIVVKAQKDDTTPVDTTNFKLFDGTTTKSGSTLDNVAVTVNNIKDGYGIGFEVINQKGFLLPITGEMGNWLMAIAGIVLVAVGGTVIVLANRKKKENISE